MKRLVIIVLVLTTTGCATLQPGESAYLAAVTADLGSTVYALETCSVCYESNILTSGISGDYEKVAVLTVFNIVTWYLMRHAIDKLPDENQRVIWWSGAILRMGIAAYNVRVATQNKDTEVP